MKQLSVDFSDSDAQSFGTGHGTQTPSASHSTVAPPESQISSRFKEFKVSLAYEKSLTKEKCGLCKMYFRRETVRYKVPMHRIHELHKSWSAGAGQDTLSLTGRRYQSPSFLYTTVLVCTFCSQLFMVLPEDVPQKTSDALGETILSHGKADGPRLTLATEIARTNIALSQRTYQSSMVDNKLPGYATLPPYELCSRTRREADPWWEIDLGRRQHVHSLSLCVLVGVRQLLRVFVALLDKPVGFEDPFLDSVRGAASLVKEITFSQQDKARTERVHWELPSHTQCFAVRVQLQGVQTLCLSRVVILQGDDFVDADERDCEMLANSFAALPMSAVKEGLKEYAAMDRVATPSAARDNGGTAQGDRAKLHATHAARVSLLTAQAKEKYHSLLLWKERALQAVQGVDGEEIAAMHKVVFKYAADLDPANTATTHAFADHELLSDSALVQHRPRCDLREIHTRLRSVVRWLQTQSHLKALGTLQNSPRLLRVAESPDEPVFQFMSAIKRIEYYWDKKEALEAELHEKKERERERREQQRIHHSSLSLSPTNKNSKTQREREHQETHVIAPKTSDLRGCSWTQFLIIMDLFCKNQCHLIPSLAFNISNPHVTIGERDLPEDLGSKYSYQSDDAFSVSSFAVSLARGESKTMNLNMSTSLFAGVDKSPLMFFMDQQDAMKAQRKSLKEIVRDQGFNPFESGYSEFKFDRFKRRTALHDMTFPKELSLEFAATLVPKRAMTSHGLSMSASHTLSDLRLGAQLENSVDLTCASTDDRSQHSGSTADPLFAEFTGAQGRPGLTRCSTKMSLMKRGKSVKDLARSTSLVSVKSATTHALTPIVDSKAPFVANIRSPSPTKTVKHVKTTSFRDDVSEGFDDFDDDEYGVHAEKKELINIDFFRVCCLCELRLPRASVDIKVLRKHVVKLR